MAHCRVCGVPPVQPRRHQRTAAGPSAAGKQGPPAVVVCGLLPSLRRHRLPPVFSTELVIGWLGLLLLLCFALHHPDKSARCLETLLCRPVPQEWPNEHSGLIVPVSSPPPSEAGSPPPPAQQGSGGQAASPPPASGEEEAASPPPPPGEGAAGSPPPPAGDNGTGSPPPPAGDGPSSPPPPAAAASPQPPAGGQEQPASSPPPPAGVEAASPPPPREGAASPSPSPEASSPPPHNSPSLPPLASPAASPGPPPQLLLSPPPARSPPPPSLTASPPLDPQLPIPVTFQAVLPLETLASFDAAKQAAYTEAVAQGTGGEWGGWPAAGPLLLCGKAAGWGVGACRRMTLAVPCCKRGCLHILICALPG